MGHGTIIYKTATAEFLDEFYANPPEGLDNAEQLFANFADLPDTTTELNNNFGLDPSAGNADDFRKFWLSGSSPFGSEEVARVLRHGYGEAIRIAREEYPAPGAPIETFWVAGGSEHFELHICQGVRSVTVFMFVPAARRFGSKQAGTQSFVVRAGGLREDAQALHEGDENQAPIVKIKVSGRDTSSP
jgi:hypothetical protein